MIKQEMNGRILGFPYFSFYTKHFKELFELLDLNVTEPIPITEETIRLGVKYSPEMMCFPYKVVLGNFLQLINERKVNTLVMFNSCGQCKFRHYYKLVELKLNDLGYDFEMIDLTPKDLLPIPIPSFMDKLVYLSGRNKWQIAKVIRKKWVEIKEEENRYYVKDFGMINIVITGEIFSVLEENINHNIKKQLEDLGVTVHSTLNVRALITSGIYQTKEKKILRKKALTFLDKVEIGGHGLHTIEDCLYWSEKGIDGIIHIMPLTCHPEILVEDITDHICKETKTPMLKVKIDETCSPLNVQTRIETFVEFIKRNKRREK